MFVDPKLLTKPIIDLLSTGPPLKAKEIALIIRKQLKIPELQKADVNLVLYGDLRNVAEHDAYFRWFLRKGQKADKELQVHLVSGGERQATPSKAPRSAVQTNQASLLRTIHRLRCGLPPNEHMEKLTVGQERNIAKVHALLDKGADQRQWIFIEGDYGQGKSHVLALTRDIAHRKGIATVQICADGYGSALNQPQRFMPILLSTLEIPGKNPKGYVDLLHDTLLDRDRAITLQEITRRYLRSDARRGLEVEVDELLSGIIYWLGRRNPSSKDEELGYATGKIAYHLSGESIRYRGSSPQIRDLAYNLLRIARDLVISNGSGSLIVMIDEAESIYTKLINPLSRKGAFRVLAHMCESKDLKGCPVAIAITPDARKLLAKLVPEIMIDSPAYFTEPVRKWTSLLSSGQIETIQCRPLQEDDRLRLLHQIKFLYSEVYPNGCMPPDQYKKWDEYTFKLVRSETPIRLLVRQAIDYLDCHRYNPQAN